MKHAGRIRNELAFFENAAAFSDLPAIMQWWSQKFLRPRINALFGDGDFYSKPIVEKAKTQSFVNVLSLGTGNGQTEITLADRVLRAGITNFRILGIELSPVLVERSNAIRGATEANVSFRQGDINDVRIEEQFDFVILSQILHHVVGLETLLDRIARAIARGGEILIRDMIGMNGHQAWPEALEIINRIWTSMPKRYKYHHRLKRHYEQFPNIDFSTSGFEGVRCQDILPLLIERFHFSHFYAYGGIVERFIGRGFGPNYDAALEQDRAFVILLQELNDATVDGGIIKPTQLVARLGVKASLSSMVWKQRTPEFCVHRG